MITKLPNPVPCGACWLSLDWPIWTPRGDGEYIALCDACMHALDYALCPEGAIAEAQRIIRDWHTALDTPPSIIRRRPRTGGDV